MNPQLFRPPRGMQESVWLICVFLSIYAFCSLLIYIIVIDVSRGKMDNSEKSDVFLELEHLLLPPPSRRCRPNEEDGTVEVEITV